MRIGARVLALLVYAAAAIAQTPAELQPRLVPWSSDRFFSGVVSPESSESETRFVLDATLTTSRGVNYYALGIKLRTALPSTFRIVWQRSGQPDLQVVREGSTSCATAIGAVDTQSVLLTLNAREGRRQTGRESPGAAEGPQQTRIDRNEPFFLYECVEEQVPHERRLRILIPERRIQFGGRLVITAEGAPPLEPRPGGLPDLDPRPVVPIVSEPLVLTLRRGAPKLLIVGDSIAWGQGVPPASSTGMQVFLDMVRKYGGQTVSFTSKAHSGATVNRDGLRRISEINPNDCLFQRELFGEIPRAEPTVQCQVLDAATRECFVDSAAIGVAPVPFFFCQDGLPRRTQHPGETRFNFELGPAYDVVVTWACVNDVDSFDIVAGEQTPEQIALRASVECNLTNGLADLRDFLPNAKIIVNQYQRIISRFTDVTVSGCVTRDQVATFDRFVGNTRLAFFTNENTRARAAGRSAAFRDAARDAQIASIPALNVGAGRGSVEFLDQPAFDPEGSAMWTAGSLLFPLVCNASGAFAAVDPVRTTRAVACARLLETTAADPFRIADPNFMKCVRASAFHPNVEAYRQFANRIITDQRRFYPRMLNFSAANPELVNPNGPRP
jgi:hypothetical protein